MRTISTKFAAAFTVAALALSTTTAFACGNDGGNKGRIGFSSGGGGFGVSLHSGNNNRNNYIQKNNGNCSNHGGYPYEQPYGQVYGQAYEPFHSSYICQPGDTFHTVSMKEYGTSGAASYISRFNRLPFNAALVTGQRLILPSVSRNGGMTVSRAPAPFVDVTPGVGENPTAKFTKPNTTATTNLASSVTAPATEPESELSSVAVGSTLVLDGQVYGEAEGVARLSVGGLSLPIKVLEWTNTSVTIQLPDVDITSPVKAEIGVLRADGSVASTTAVELKSAADRLARGN